MAGGQHQIEHYLNNKHLDTWTGRKKVSVCLMMSEVWKLITATTTTTTSNKCSSFVEEFVQEEVVVKIVVLMVVFEKRGGSNSLVNMLV